MWQPDTSPHRWFGAGYATFPMLNLLDDCPRMYTASKLYERELLLAYFTYGLPLELYVDYHSLFLRKR